MTDFWVHGKSSCRQKKTPWNGGKFFYVELLLLRKSGRMNTKWPDCLSIEGNIINCNWCHNGSTHSQKNAGGLCIHLLESFENVIIRHGFEYFVRNSGVS